MLPDQGCYEERYRLTFPVARGTAFSLVPLIVAIFSHQPLPWVILAPVVFALATVPWLVAVASRKVAFRADMAGITLGADPLSWPFRHASAVFVPWSDAEEIAWYQGGGPSGWRIGDDPCIGIQRRQGARPCPAATSLPAAARCPASPPGPSARSLPGGWTATALPRSPRRQRPASLSSMLELARTRALTGPTKQAVWQGQDPRIKRQAHPSSKSSEFRPSFGWPGSPCLPWCAEISAVHSRCCSYTYAREPQPH